jgi:rhamnulokinase
VGQVKRLLAVDLGAESGRTVLGSFDGERLAVEEIRRFPNMPVEVGGTLQWDVLRLYADVLDGVRAAGPVESLGVDTWGVDFGLLDRAGRLLGNPVHYRDRRTAGMPEATFRLVPREEIYERTGIQFIPINTLFQLMALVTSKDPQLEVADRILTMPALLAYWLTGTQADEFTDATTTQCYDPRAGSWATGMLEKLGIPARIFGDVVQPGTDLGAPRAELALEASRVIAPATHDTASAVAAVPFESNDAAFISSGTWSLVGVEIGEPVINQQALEANLTNEGGVAGTFRLLKNVMGLWLLQECRRAWSVKGADMPYDDLLRLADGAPPFAAVIDPDDERLLRRPGDMPALIAQLAAESGQRLRPEPGAVARCILESLALKYRRTIDQLERVSGLTIRTVHVVGGGSNNRLLCQMTADACGRPVVAGPAEATSLGNLLVQAIALNLVSSLEQARELVRRSVALELYEPKSTHEWDIAGHTEQRSWA